MKTQTDKYENKVNEKQETPITGVVLSLAIAAGMLFGGVKYMNHVSAERKLNPDYKMFQANSDSLENKAYGGVK